MAEIKLIIPDNQITEILNAFDSVYPGREGLTKAVWAKKKVAEHVISIVHQYRTREAQKLINSGEVDIT